MFALKKLNIIAILLAVGALAGGGFFVMNKKTSEDHTPPEITIDNNIITCSIEATEEDLKAGVTATDDIDGDLTDRILIDDIQITPMPVDEDGNPVPPDGYVEGKTFDITYVVFDSSNNLSTATRTLVYSDYHSPRFEILKPLQFTSASSVQLYSIIGAEDCIDGTLTNQISIEMSDAFQDAVSPGEYECSVRVTNSLGDTSELPLTFTVLSPDVTRPEIVLSQYLVYLHCGDKFKPKSYLESIYVDNSGFRLLSDAEIGDQMSIATPRGYGYSTQQLGAFMSKNQIKVTSDVDVNVPGVYSTVYSYKHPEEETRGFARLIVVVE